MSNGTGATPEPDPGNAGEGKRGQMSDGNGTPGSGSGGAVRGGLRTISSDPVEGLAPMPELPASERQFLTDGELQVPVRRITVGGGEPPIDVYDPAGPRAADLHVGLPKLRQPWIDRRVARGDTNFSQMHYARRGEITEEMRFVALREGIIPLPLDRAWSKIGDGNRHG